MNASNEQGHGLLKRLLDYRNRAEEMRILATDMHSETAVLLFSIASGYDRMAETLQAILSRSANLAP